MDELKAGEAYLFRTIKETVIAGEEFLILEDPYGNRHMLPMKFYKHYGIENMEELKCYVDKINCRGQIFLEPEHPLYKRKSVHNFKYIKKDHRITKQGIEINVIIVEDKYQRLCTILPNNDFQMTEQFAPETIKCKVERVKKSLLFLENINFIDQENYAKK